MLSTLGLTFSLGVLAGLTWLLASARRGLSVTTLQAAWWWMLGVGALWTASALIVFVDGSSPEIQAQSLYWTGIVALCPGIAVLGARRPGSRVWNFFIVVPLVLVLGWPAVTVWRADGPRLFTAEWPVLGGLLLVLVMGTGNYLGTRFAAAAALYAASIVALVAPASVAMSRSGSDLIGATRWMFATATLLIGGAGWLSFRANRTDGPPRGVETETARLWNDFRETFGIVWGTRLRERLQQEADREKWPANAFPGSEGLEFPGEASDEDRAKSEARYRHHLLWLLRRFVDPEWIDERTKHPASRIQGGATSPP